MENYRNILATAVVISLLVSSFAVLGFGAGHDTLTVSFWEATNTLDPANCHRTYTANKLYLVYNTLIGRDKNGDLVPELATNWEMSKGGTEVTLQLREDVEFHDGTKFDAEAVKANFDRILDKENALYARDDFKVISEVVAVDEYTVKFNLKRPYGPFLLNLTSFQAGIISPAALEKYGDKINENPVGTGPYEFQNWSRGEELVLVRNENYWGEKPEIQKFVFEPILEAGSMIAALKSGQVDVIQPVPPQFIKGLQKDTSTKVLAEPGTRIYWVTMNTRRKPLDSRAVRQALNYAVDYKALAEELYYGYASKATYIPKGVLGNSEYNEPYSYKPELAETLLEEAGYPDSFTVTIWIENKPLYTRLAEALAGFWEEIGVKLEIESMESGVYFDRLGKPLEENGVEMTVNNWSSLDPNNSLSPLLNSANRPPNGLNWAFYHNPKVDQLLNKGVHTMDRQKRQEIYENVESILVAEAPWIIPFGKMNIIAHQKDVAGLWLEAGGTLRFEEAYIKS